MPYPPNGHLLVLLLPLELRELVSFPSHLTNPESTCHMPLGLPIAQPHWWLLLYMGSGIFTILVTFWSGCASFQFSKCALCIQRTQKHFPYLISTPPTLGTWIFILQNKPGTFKTPEWGLDQNNVSSFDDSSGQVEKDWKSPRS